MKTAILPAKTGLPFGSYCLKKEISTDSHYILSDTEYPVVFEYAGQDTALVEIRANDGAAIENNLIYGEVQGMKRTTAEMPWAVR